MATSPSISQARLRTLARRALRIHDRLEQRHPAIEAIAPQLLSGARAYIEAYDAAAAFQSTQNAEMAGGRQHVEALYRSLQAWLSVLERDIQGFERSQLGGRPDAPDRVIGDAERLIELVEPHDEALPYAQTLLTELREVLGRAEAEWSQAQQALVTQQQLRTKVRETAAVVHRELITFRRTLRSVLGASHRDYQALRASRNHSGDESADEVEIAIEDETQPSPANGHPPEPHAQGTFGV